MLTFEDAEAPEIIDELVRLNGAIGHVSDPVFEIHRDAMLAAIRTAMMRVQLGQVARAGAIVDRVREDVWTVGLEV